MKTQSYRSPYGWFQLEYPRTWEVEVIEGIPTFFEGLFNRGGVLQVFAVKTGDSKQKSKIIDESPFLKGKSLAEKMQLFLEQQDIAYEEDQLRIFERDSMEAIATEYNHSGHFYLAVMLQRDPIFLLALYNVKGEPETEEAQEIAAIVQSIQIREIHLP